MKKKLINLALAVALVAATTVPASAAGINWGAAQASISNAAAQYYAPICKLISQLAELLRGWM